MRTKIYGGWVVGYKNGHHVILKDAEVVYNDGKIEYVGYSYEGSVDKTIDASNKLVSPGFIDTHVHSGHRALHKLISDHGRNDLYGQPFMEVTIARKGTQIVGYPNYLTSDQAKLDPTLQLHSTFTITELLRNGVTTFVELGAQALIQEALSKQCIALGVRGYLGPGYDSARWSSDEEGNLSRVKYEDGGKHLFDNAISFINKVQRDNNELVHGILMPRELETCSIDILKDTVSAAKELNVPIAIHAAYNSIEFHEIVKQYRKTPIQLLDSVGMLTPTVNIGHANIVSDVIPSYTAGGSDISLMGENGVSVSHCPTNIVRRARFLKSWERYKKAGINLTIGSDTYPRDMVMNMREASYHGKVMSHNLTSATAYEVFESATLGGAKSLGRDDIGRLEPGAIADIIIINLDRKDTLRYGPIWDPIRSLIECGVGDDVDTVITSGIERMVNGAIPGVDMGAIREDVQTAASEIWNHVQDWDPLKRTAQEMCPISLCPDCDRH